jgi:TRAP-type C4-dicarboxylate transport system permease small subunit
MAAPEPDRPPEPTPMLALEEDAIDLSDQHWTDGVVLAVFWILAFVVFLQFFTRYVLNDSIAWTEEIARFLLIGVTFVGAVMATRKQAHIAVEFVYRWIPRAGRRVLQTVLDVVSTAFFATLAVLSAQIAGRTQQMMVSIDVPKSSVYWIVAACFALMAAHAAWHGWRHLRTGTSRLIDPAAHADAVRSVD